MSFEDKPKISSELNNELELAELSYSQQDFIQSIYHLGSAISLDPVNPKALTLLKTVLEKSVININSISIDNENNNHWVENCSVVTYIQGLTKQYDLALVNLIKLLLSTQETLYLYWLEGWVTDEDFFKILGLDVLKKTLVELMKLPNQSEFNHNIREIYEFFLMLLQKAENYYDFDESLNYIMAVIARRCLQFHKSILIAAKSYGVKPSYFNTLALAYAYRELKDYDNTVRFFLEAIAFKPEFIEVKLDLADFMFERVNSNSDDYKKGIQLYEDVIELKPNHEWAYPSYLYHSYMIDHNPSVLEKLKLFSLNKPDNKRASKLLDKINKKK